MARLSQQALEQYRQQGFVRDGKILSDRVLARLREEIDRLIAELPEGTRPENMPSVHYRNRSSTFRPASASIAPSCLPPGSIGPV